MDKELFVARLLDLFDSIAESGRLERTRIARDFVNDIIEVVEYNAGLDRWD